MPPFCGSAVVPGRSGAAGPSGAASGGGVREYPPGAFRCLPSQAAQEGWQAMRAIRVDHFGEPDVLRLVETQPPQMAPGEVLVRVAAAGVNQIGRESCR